MSKRRHPDAQCSAAAQVRADGSGHPSRSLEWQRVYRDAYEDVARPGEPGLDDFLAVLEQGIKDEEAERHS